jgi:hypothetical protein
MSERRRCWSTTPATGPVRPTPSTHLTHHRPTMSRENGTSFILPNSLKINGLLHPPTAAGWCRADVDGGGPPAGRPDSERAADAVRWGGKGSPSRRREMIDWTSYLVILSCRLERHPTRHRSGGVLERFANGWRTRPHRCGLDIPSAGLARNFLPASFSPGGTFRASPGPYYNLCVHITMYIANPIPRLFLDVLGDRGGWQPGGRSQSTAKTPRTPRRRKHDRGFFPLF